jgi:hypothetical protein
VHEYREGKVKSTGMTGVKQFLKPDAYKQSELGCQVSGARIAEGDFRFPGSWFLAPGDGVPFV